MAVIFLPHHVPVSRLEPLWCLTAVIVLFTFHELLHALAFMLFGHRSWSAFKFGWHWRQLVAYCHCRQPVTIRAFRYGALAPLATLGSLTILATLLYPAIWLAVAAATHLAGCAGDVWVFASSRQFPDNFLFSDFPDKIGGQVFQPAQDTACDPTPVRNATLVL